MSAMDWMAVPGQCGTDPVDPAPMVISYSGGEGLNLTGTDEVSRKADYRTWIDAQLYVACAGNGGAPGTIAKPGRREERPRGGQRARQRLPDGRRPRVEQQPGPYGRRPDEAERRRGRHDDDLAAGGHVQRVSEHGRLQHRDAARHRARGPAHAALPAAPVQAGAGARAPDGDRDGPRRRGRQEQRVRARPRLELRRALGPSELRWLGDEALLRHHQFLRLRLRRHHGPAGRAAPGGRADLGRAAGERGRKPRRALRHRPVRSRRRLRGSGRHERRLQRARLGVDGRQRRVPGGPPLLSPARTG